MKRLLPLVLIFGVINFMTAQSHAQSEESKKELPINEWLQAGPVKTPLPAFHGDDFKLKDLQNFEARSVSSWWPSANENLAWSGGQQLTWTAVNSGNEGLVIKQGKGKSPQTVYLAAYIDASRWVKGKLTIHSRHLLTLYVNGENVTKKSSSEKEDAGKLSYNLKLETGKHLVLLKVLSDPDVDAAMDIKAVLTLDDPASEADITLSTSPTQVMNVHHLLDGPKISGVSISADGEWATVQYRRVLPEDGGSESWLELRNVNTGQLIQTFRARTALGRVSWAPSGKTFAYTKSAKKKTTLWIVDLPSGSQTALLEDVTDFGGFSWAPDGSFIIYTVTETPEADKRGVKHFRSLRDKWPYFRTNEYLYRVDVNSGARQRLTSGKLGTSMGAISPDGKKLIFSQTVDNYEQRPYTQSTLSVLSLATLKVDTLGQFGWIGNVQWSPNGKKLLISGGASLFDGIGRNLPEGVISNDYDTQAFIYDIAGKSVTPITKDFDPAINSGYWHDNNTIYFSAIDREYDRLFAYSVKKNSFQQLDTGIDVVSSYSIARNKPVAIYFGSSAQMPHQAYILDLKKNKHRRLSAPEQTTYANVSFGDLKTFNFTNNQGTTIDGRVYYPPNFDPAQEYPCIVYYYGGTSVVERNFGGRYPLNLFAAQGYMVYVMQPSGAPGFGQAFSALHVNDWGKQAASDIMEGTQKFLEAHPFVNKDKIGCIGASYGGFMTMSLLTQTDMFATGISHAGISALSSYWGEGYWGYLYSSVATAESFPWNRKDIYVDQSPLFNADKVNKPLLLLHGDSDTNVPPGESDQFYVALKLLGKDVEYVQVKGQDHHILDYKKRIIWQKTILAWFDKQLKGQGEWWSDLYPER